jgi:hypothetical protein
MIGKWCGRFRGMIVDNRLPGKFRIDDHLATLDEGLEVTDV